MVTAAQPPQVRPLEVLFLDDGRVSVSGYFVELNSFGFIFPLAGVSLLPTCDLLLWFVLSMSSCPRSLKVWRYEDVSLASPLLEP